MTDGNAKLHMLAHSTINGRGIWHYMFESELIPIHVVQYEAKGFEVHTFMFTSDQQADKKYNAISLKMVKGQL